MFSFFFAIILLGVPSSMANSELEKFQRLSKVCDFMAQRIARSFDTENIATVTVGDIIQDGLERMTSRDVPSTEKSNSALRGFLQQMVNIGTYHEKILEQTRKNLHVCVKRLVRKKRGDTLRLKIKKHSEDLELMLLNGQDFIKRIVFDASIEFSKAFFINIVQGVLSPFTTKDTIVQDIGIGTANKGFWDRDVMVELFNEEHFSKMTYRGGEKPVWQADFSLSDTLNLSIQLCQWPKEMGLCQKFRLTVSKPQGFSEMIGSLFNPPVEEICF